MFSLHIILYCDLHFGQKREQRLEVQSSFPRTLLHAGRTFVMGVVLGLSGVVVKPVAGKLMGNIINNGAVTSLT